MKIRSLKISGMHNVDHKTYTFEDLNYLYGLNGSGKSTVLNAIQLGILGYIPGTAKTVSSIFKHANGPEMKIDIQFDNGNFICRSWCVKGRSIDSKVDSNVSDISELIKDLELPVFNFNELINLSANKLKDWFIKFLPDASSSIDWKKELSESLNGLNILNENLIDNTLYQIDLFETTSTLQLIQSLNGFLKEEQYYLKKELERSQATIQSLVYYDEDDLTGDSKYLDEQIQKSHNCIRLLTSEKEQLISARQIIQSNSDIRNQLNSIPTHDCNVDELQTQIKSIPEEIKELQGEIQSIDSEIQKIYQKNFEYSADIKSKNSIISGKGLCPYTQAKCESIISLIETFQIQIADITDKQNHLQEDLKSLQEEKIKLNAVLNKKQQILNQLNSKILTIRNDDTRRTQLLSLIKPEPDVSEFKALDDYTHEIAKHNRRIAKIQSNKKYNQLIDKLTKEKYQIENTIEAYKCWIKLTDPNGLQTKIMDAPFNEFADDMTKYLQIMFSTDVKCKFNLEQKANSFSLGILKQSTMNKEYYIPYDLLSSGEKTMYTLSMMLCIINKSKSPLKLLIIDDMLDHLDDLRADEVFSAISNVHDIQVILAGVKLSDNAKSYIIEVA